MEIVEFRNELLNHPDLYLEASKLDTYSEIIGFVSAKLGIAIDGSFDYDEMRVLLATLTDQLYRRRKLTLLSVDAVNQQRLT
jgi:hypothetical protein